MNAPFVKKNNIKLIFINLYIMLIEMVSYTLIGIFVIPFIVGICCIEGEERVHRGHHRG